MRGEHPRERDPRQGVDALVVGAGRFGSRALTELARIHPRWRLMVVDREAGAIDVWRGRGVTVRLGDAVETMDRLLRQAPPKWVVPAVPFHLACSWLHHRISQTRPVERIPLHGGLPVPNPLLGPSGDLYASWATFLCPEDCAEPRETCTVTGERRPLALYRLLEQLAVPGRRIYGLRSYQLGRGVGGFRSRELCNLMAAVQDVHGDLILYTACRCHGVLSALRVGIAGRTVDVDN